MAGILRVRGGLGLSHRLFGWARAGIATDPHSDM